MALRAGVTKVNITPPIGCWMGGYGGRTHGAVGVRDELWARALYLTDEVNEIILISAEMLGLTEESVRRIRERIQQETGIPASCVSISATHTHSGPQIRTEEADGLTARHLAATEDKIAGAAIWAKAEAAPASLSWARQGVQCGVNRRERRDGRIVLGVNPDGPVDPYVDVLCVRGASGEVRAVWFSHACHPVVMGTQNYWISGDFVGAAARFVEANGGGVALFANGCTGDINSFPHNADFAAVDRLGARLGAAVIGALSGMPSEGDAEPRLAALEHGFRLPTEPVPSLSETDEAVRRAESELEAASAAGNPNRTYWARRELRMAKARRELAREGATWDGAPMTIQVVTIGEAALVGIPAEVFVEIGFAIRHASPFKRTIVTGYTNGYQGYLPTRSAFPEGGYEVNVRIRHRGLAITPDAPDVLVRECIAALQRARDAGGARRRARDGGRLVRALETEGAVRWADRCLYSQQGNAWIWLEFKLRRIGPPDRR